MRRVTPVVLCIDVEPDPFVFDPGDPPAPWHGFERLLQRLPDLRRRIAEATGAPAAFTWFLRMDPQVMETWGSASWLAEEHQDVFAELTEAGDELGLHTHLWRWDADAGECFADFQDGAWATSCVEMALDAYQASFGRPCRAHRGGTFFLSGAMLARLGARGVAVDLTAEPGRGPLGPEGIGEPARGDTPDYRGVPVRPYRSTPTRFPAPDPGARTGPLLVPLMSVRRTRPPFRRVPLPVWLPFAMPNVALALVRRPPIVAVAMRTSSALDPEWGVIEKNLDYLASRRRVAFMTASAAAERHELLSSSREASESQYA